MSHDALVIADHRVPDAATLAGMRVRAERFLDRCAAPPWIDQDLSDVVGSGPPRERVERLAAAAGFPGRAEAFFAELRSRLETITPAAAHRFTLGGIVLSKAFLLAMLEELMPGERIIDVDTVEQLERLTSVTVEEPDRASMAQVLQHYPVRLSQHTLRQMRLSEAVACQYLPFVEELDTEGLTDTWIGQFHRGIIERMYRNRVILLLNMACPVYCRFCFRKHKQCRQQPPPTLRQVDEAIAYLRSCKEIKEVVLTGGDPFMNRATLTRAVAGLLELPQIETLRIATRSLSYHPALFRHRNGYWLDYLKRTQREADSCGTRLEIATHFIHPDELSPASVELINELVSSGIAVYVQTPLLGSCNDTGDELAELYRVLRAAGAEMHYVFMPCSPLKGNRRYRSTLSTGLAAAASLRGNLSDRAIPHFCTATAIGKIDWGSNGWAVEEDARDHRFVWLRTPYTTQYFKQFAPDVDIAAVTRGNNEGTLDARFMASMGERSWLMGRRQPVTAATATPQVEPDTLPTVLSQLYGGPWTEPSIRGLACPVPGARRVHRTRVLLDHDLTAGQLRPLVEWLATTVEITDVVLHVERLTATTLATVEAFTERLAPLPHVTALRLRSLAYATDPTSFSDELLDRLVACNRLRLLASLRLEVETAFLHSSVFSAAHQHLVRRLGNRGVTVYSSTPLLAGINDSPEELLRIAGSCRRLGIEMHHVVVAGHPVQAAWAAQRSLSLGRVVELSDHLRRFGSGRELPHYVVMTERGEVDLGLTARVIGAAADGQVTLRLLAYPDSNGEPATVTVPGLVP